MLAAKYVMLHIAKHQKQKNLNPYLMLAKDNNTRNRKKPAMQSPMLLSVVKCHDHRPSNVFAVCEQPNIGIIHMAIPIIIGLT